MVLVVGYVGVVVTMGLVGRKDWWYLVVVMIVFWERECDGGMMKKAVVSPGMACGDRVGCRLRETRRACACWAC